jgi:signal transduction histidine kinase
MTLNLAVFVVPLVLGVLLLVVVAYLKYQSHQLKQRIQALYDINQAVQQDALDFIQQAWSVLQDSGSQGLRARVNWFGEQSEMCFGLLQDQPSDQQYIAQGDIAIELAFYTPSLRGEQRYMAQLVQQTFSQLLQQDIYIKLNQILLTQQRLERFQLFAQHDLKNLMQFIELLGDQVERIDSAQDQAKLIARLKVSLPAVKQRAQRTLGQLKTSLSGDTEVELIALQALVQQMAANLTLKVEAQTDDNCLYLSRPLMSEVLVNVLSNFRDHGEAQQPVCIKSYTQSGMCCLEIYQFIPGDNSGFLVKNANRLFEPFWSTSESGMGLGLFLARSLLTKIGGEIHLINQNQRLGFLLRLPMQPQTPHSVISTTPN